MQRTVLKKREDFAINLRKKKHSEIIQSKRKSNMQKAFERTIVASSGQDDSDQQAAAVSVDEFMEIRDVQHLDEVIANIDDPKYQSRERILMLRGIRQLTIHSQDYQIIN